MRAKTATGVTREESRKNSEVASISGSSLGSVSSSKSSKSSASKGSSRTQSRGQRSTKSALVRSLKSRASSAAPSTMSQRQVLWLISTELWNNERENAETFWGITAFDFKSAEDS